MRAILAAVMVLVGAGCFGNEESPFPDGLEPLEDNTAPLPPGDGYPEVLSAVYGEDLDYDWGHARGYVHASAADTYAALHDPDIVIDRRNTDVQTFELHADPMYAHSFLIHYEVDRFIRVEWDELWRFGAVEGTEQAPTLAMIRYQKVYGTEFIELLEGSVLIVEVTPEVTEVQLIQHVDATQSGTKEIRGTFESQYANLLAAVRGDPLPF